jgi:Family of unknown function (DUF5684)
MDVVAASSGAGLAAILVIVYLAVIVFYIATMWRIFSKANKPGWAVIVPIYNYVVADEITGRPGWWILLWLVGIGSIIFPFDLARSFGKSSGYGVGLLLLAPIFFPMLAFSDAQYVGPGGVRPAYAGVPSM